MRVPTAPRGQEVALVKRKRHTPEQIIRKLREAEALLEEGTELPEVMRRLEISVQTYHRWKTQYHSMRPADVVELKTLRKELPLARSPRGSGDPVDPGQPRSFERGSIVGRAPRVRSGH